METQELAAQAGGIRAVYPSEAANDLGREFRVTLTWDGGCEGFTDRFLDSVEAACEGRVRLGERFGKVQVRPIIETTMLEGRARWPEALHPHASVEAAEGWARAAMGAEVPARVISVLPREQLLRDHHDDEYAAGLDDVPTARMERANPARWAE